MFSATWLPLSLRGGTTLSITGSFAMSTVILKLPNTILKLFSFFSALWKVVDWLFLYHKVTLQNSVDTAVSLRQKILTLMQQARRLRIHWCVRINIAFLHRLRDRVCHPGKYDRSDVKKKTWNRDLWSIHMVTICCFLLTDIPRSYSWLTNRELYWKYGHGVFARVFRRLYWCWADRNV